jgi:DNA-binding transcriptional ArsR family regulator
MDPLSKAELIIHPLRLRIIEAVQGREVTTQQIARLLPEVPQASLYRHIKMLVDGGILDVTGERRVNGIVERTYAVRKGSSRFSREEFAAISPVDHSRYFAVFLGTLASRMDHYLQQQEYDIIGEGMTYFQAVVNLTDEESQALRLELLDIAKRVVKPESTGERRARTLGVALIPEAIDLEERKDA